MDYFSYPERDLTHNDEDNIIAALEHPNRVCYVNLRITSLQLGKVATGHGNAGAISGVEISSHLPGNASRQYPLD